MSIVYLPLSSAAAAVTILNVEPGTKRPAVARFNSGAACGQSARVREDRAVVLVDQVRIVGRASSPSPAPSRSTARSRRPTRTCRPSACIATRCARGIEREDEIVADDVPAEQLVDLGVDDRAQVRVRAREEVVLRPLEPGSRAAPASSSRRHARQARASGSGGSRASGRSPSAPGSSRSTVFRRRRRSCPRSIVNCATSWIALSWRSARPAAAHACQYVVARISAPSSASANDRQPGDLPVHIAWRVARGWRPAAGRASRMKFASRLEPP